MTHRILPSMTPSLAVAVAGLVLTGAGCSSRLARENVFANTESSFGITLAENPQTQIYEFKLGYARHELFYVPSSKMAFYKRNGKGIGGETPPPGVTNYNDPSRTPEVLAEIQIGSSTKAREGGFQLRQRLAVGARAVESPAAKAMLANPSAASAEALVEAINSPANEKLRAQYDELVKKELKSPVTANGAALRTTAELADYLANEIEPGQTAANVRTWGGEHLQELNKRLQSYVK